jgi:hypothetical protein
MNRCTTCANTRFLEQGKCVAMCQIQGFYEKAGDNICAPCPGPCTDCHQGNDLSLCTGCKSSGGVDYFFEPASGCLTKT